MKNNPLTSLLFLIALAVLVGSCSNQKNTLMSRSYHNLTAHYNVLFNGGESFKKGMKYIDENYKDDYSRTLPVFVYGNKETATSISSNMDGAIKKGSKCIALHSIKAKPKFDKGHMTIEQKEYYNKNEYNKWIDDAYLLIGKSHLYKQDYDNALQTFNFVTREFQKEPAMFEAYIWSARVDCEIGELKEAGILLNTAENDRRFPKDKYALDVIVTWADLYIKQNKPYEAIKQLEKALPLVRKKKVKLRYMFILAQLYQQTNQFNKAVDMYSALIRKNPPYEMTFNAKLNMASSTVSGSNSDMMRQLLSKMLRDSKNKEFQDQIYYAFGNVEMRDGNAPKAVEYYKKSVQVSSGNNAQKTLSCLTLGNFYYDHKIYVPAQAYYDSALQTIDERYPDIEGLKVKANSLTRLVKNLNAISAEDSMQRIAKMPESDRLRLIDKIIQDLKQKEEEEKQAEAQRLQEYYNNQSRQAMLGQAGASQQQTKWYFYNQVSVSQGIRDFQLKWGRRRLEDNWQRKNKGINEFAGDNDDNVDAEKDKNEKKKVLDNKSREYYTQNLPITDSAKEVSTQRIISSYYEGGLVYRNELKDLPQAILLYEKMMARYPDCEYNTTVYYQLYSMNVEQKNEGRAAFYKNLLLSKFPNSTAAKIISDTSFYRQVMMEEKIVDEFYQTTFAMYNNGQYQQVLANVASAFSRFKDNPMLPRFALLKALAIGKTNSNIVVFRNELNKVIADYPKHEVSKYAKEVISFMNTFKPESKVAEDVKAAAITYVSDSTANAWYLGIVVDKKEDVNQVVFEIINFNLDNFPNDKLELKNEDMGKQFKVITVRGFDKKEKAIQYYKVFDSKPEVLKAVKGTIKKYFVISPANYDILKKQDETDIYMQHFKLKILQQP